MKILYRQNNMFKIDESKLSDKAKKIDVINALYASIYEEFKGAVNNFKYKNLTPLQKIDKLNEFALNWLKERGF